MEKPIIEVKKIGKRYKILHERGKYVSLRDVLVDVAKKPLSFLKRKVRQTIGLETKEDFWALKNVNFEVTRGEVVGIIGQNGAGKSTLLKILSQITPPTEGEIVIRGRVGSLLEVGTGFHPELTGRENIFLNGAILGMSRREIAAKFDQIVEFSGIERFLDTPVKHYSSGMYVRLAFSVAAHMEPDILIVDEVLAVGDAEFQKKCLGKMDEITKKEGRTIILVSHSMSAIQSLCQRCILIERGSVKMFDTTDKVIEAYTSRTLGEKRAKIKDRRDRTGSGKLYVTGFKLLDQRGLETTHFVSGENGAMIIEYELKDPSLKRVDVSIGIDSFPAQNRIALISSEVVKQDVKISGSGIIKIRLPKLALNAGTYQFTVFIEDKGKVVDWIKNAGEIEVVTGHFYHTGKLPKQGNMLVEYEFVND